MDLPVWSPWLAKNKGPVLSNRAKSTTRRRREEAVVLGGDNLPETV
jgi:hypothetical protein